MPHAEAISRENEERGLNQELPPRANPDIPRIRELFVVVQNPAPPNPNPLEEQRNKRQQEENEQKEDAEICQSKAHEVPNPAHNEEHHQPVPQNPNQIHAQIEPIIKNISSAPSNSHIHPQFPSPNQVHVPLPLIRVIPPPNSQNQNVPRELLPSTGSGQRVPKTAPNIQNNLVEVRVSNRLGAIVKMIFLLPSINEQNAKVQKKILANFYQDYSFSSFLGKLYGFLNAFKFVYFAFCLVFSYSEPLVALFGFIFLCLLSLISA